jgi:hypothetical protein
LFVAAFFPHFLNVTQCREILIRNTFDHEPTALRFPAQSRCRHAAIGKRDFSGTL